MWHKVDQTLCNFPQLNEQSLDVACPLLYDCRLPILIDQLQGRQLQMLLHFPVCQKDKKTIHDEDMSSHVVWLYGYWCLFYVICTYVNIYDSWQWMFCVRSALNCETSIWFVMMIIKNFSSKEVHLKSHKTERIFFFCGLEFVIRVNVNLIIYKAMEARQGIDTSAIGQ